MTFMRAGKCSTIYLIVRRISFAVLSTKGIPMGEDFSTTLDALNTPYMAPSSAFKVVSRMQKLSRAL